MGSRCFLSCFSRAGLGCLEASAQLGVVYHACNPSLRTEPGRFTNLRQAWTTSLSSVQELGCCSMAESLPGIYKPWVQSPVLKQKREEEEMAQLPFQHHGRPCPVPGLIHKACLPSGISEATTMDWVGGLGIRQKPHTP